MTHVKKKSRDRESEQEKKEKDISNCKSVSEVETCHRLIGRQEMQTFVKAMCPG